MNERKFMGMSFTWRNALVVAGIAMVAPYFIRRLMPLIDGRSTDVSAKDISLAGKDSVRDVADDLDVGGVSGKLNRAVDRVSDRLSH